MPLGPPGERVYAGANFKSKFQGVEMQISSKRVIESKVLPGVKFTVRRLAEYQVASRDMQTAKERVRMKEIAREWQAQTPKDGAPDTDDMQSARFVLDDEFSNLLASVIKPASIRAALISIEGLAVDDVPVTNAKEFIAALCPPLQPLADEVYVACEQAATMTEDERKNFLPPSTSSELVDGGKTDLTAEPAAA
jgi:hypothetical protein